jgi:hypothetical protein
MIKEIGEYKVELLRNCIAFNPGHKLLCTVKLTTNDELEEVEEIKLVIQNAEDENSLELLIQVHPQAFEDYITEELLDESLSEILVNKRICEIEMQRQFENIDEIDKKIQEEHYTEIMGNNYNCIFDAVDKIIENYYAR